MTFALYISEILIIHTNRCSSRLSLFHATNEGFCSWAELAEAVFRLNGRSITVQRVCTEEYGTKALCPKNSKLSKLSLDAGGFGRLPEWDASLARMLAR